jgi:hypothetical protein
MTPTEKAAKNSEARKRKKEAEEVAKLDGWRFIDLKTECFYLDSLPTNEAFPSLRLRGNVKLIDFFSEDLTKMTSLLLFSMKPQTNA